jgi:hypothetical protein
MPSRKSLYTSCRRVCRCSECGEHGRFFSAADYHAHLMKNSVRKRKLPNGALEYETESTATEDAVSVAMAGHGADPGIPASSETSTQVPSTAILNPGSPKHATGPVEPRFSLPNRIHQSETKAQKQLQAIRTAISNCSCRIPPLSSGNLLTETELSAFEMEVSELRRNMLEVKRQSSEVLAKRAELATDLEELERHLMQWRELLPRSHFEYPSGKIIPKMRNSGF